MYTRTKFSAIGMAMWTRFETLQFIIIGTAWVALYQLLDLQWLQIPWTPLALIGTAVAFVVGFQNNSAYGRIWEARKIWGGIVNTSRTFGMFVQDMITSEHAPSPKGDDELKAEIHTLTFRHIAWMTALRHAMRVRKPWECNLEHKTNREWGVHPPEHGAEIESELAEYLSAEDLAYVMDKSNKQTAVLYLQSKHLRRLKESGMLWEFSFLELERLQKDLFALQGKSERIKNFPYPRQYATLNHYFMWLFVLLLPLALVPQFAEIGANVVDSYPRIGAHFVWFTVPFFTVVAWVFHTMERIGRSGENPFEGTANDVPISTIARGIEIDLRQNLGEPKDSIPAQFPEERNIQF